MSSLFGATGTAWGEDSGDVTNIINTQITHQVLLHSNQADAHDTSGIGVSAYSSNIRPSDKTLDSLLRGLGTGLIYGCHLRQNGGPNAALVIEQGLAVMKTEAEETAHFAICAVDETAIEFADLYPDTTNYINLGWSPNGGIVEVTEVPLGTDVAYLTKFEIGRIVPHSADGTITFITAGYTLASNGLAELDAKLKELSYVDRGTGLIVSGEIVNSGVDEGSAPHLHYKMTAGTLFHGLKRYTISAKSLESPYFYYHYDKDGNEWHTSSQEGLWNVLDDVGNWETGKYATFWIYLAHKEASTDRAFRHVMLLCPESYATLADAKNAPVPANLPPELMHAAPLLLGRVIVRPRNATICHFESAFVHPIWNGQSASKHSDLAGLQGGSASDHYHLSAASYSHLAQQDQPVHSTARVSFDTVTAGVSSLKRIVMDDDHDDGVAGHSTKRLRFIMPKDDPEDSGEVPVLCAEFHDDPDAPLTSVPNFRTYGTLRAPALIVGEPDGIPAKPILLTRAAYVDGYGSTVSAAVEIDGALMTPAFCATAGDRSDPDPNNHIPPTLMADVLASQAGEGGQMTALNPIRMLAPELGTADEHLSTMGQVHAAIQAAVGSFSASPEVSLEHIKMLGIEGHESAPLLTFSNYLGGIGTGETIMTIEGPKTDPESAQAGISVRGHIRAQTLDILGSPDSSNPAIKVQGEVISEDDQVLVHPSVTMHGEVTADAFKAVPGYVDKYGITVPTQLQVERLAAPEFGSGGIDVLHPLRYSAGLNAARPDELCPLGQVQNEIDSRVEVIFPDMLKSVFESLPPIQQSVVMVGRYPPPRTWSSLSPSSLLGEFLIPAAGDWLVQYSVSVAIPEGVSTANTDLVVNEANPSPIDGSQALITKSIASHATHTAKVSVAPADVSDGPYPVYVRITADDFPEQTESADINFTLSGFALHLTLPVIGEPGDPAGPT